MQRTAVTLSDAVVRHICSGQVIKNVESAVKELVENALDAQSQSIEITLVDYGLTKLMVADDGIGIPSQNHALLGKRYVTNKLSAFEELAMAQSLHFGFRGEALHSLETLSKNLVVVSRVRDEPLGWRLEWDTQCQQMKSFPMARQPGTTITVEGLFEKVPVRLKEFKKNAMKEMQKVVLLLQSLVLVHTSIGITCQHQLTSKSQAQILFHVSKQANRNLSETIALCFGTKFLNDLAEIHLSIPLHDHFRSMMHQSSKLYINGWLSRPHGPMAYSGHKEYMSIGRRPCHLPAWTKAVHQVYRSLNILQKPFMILQLMLPEGTYDFNVSPDKKTVFIQEEPAIIALFIEKLTQTCQEMGNFDHHLKIVSSLQRVGSHSQMTGHSQKTRKGALDSMPSDSASQLEEKRTITMEKLMDNHGPASSSPHLSTSDSSMMPASGRDELDLNRDAFSPSIETLLTPLPKFPKVTVPRHFSSPRVSSTIERVDVHDHHPNSGPGVPMESVAISDPVSLQRPCMKSVAPGSSLSCDMIPSLSLASDLPFLESTPLVLTKVDFLQMQVLGQFNHGFIITRLTTRFSDDLFILDQHACDEKYRYEVLKKKTQSKASQLLLT